MPKTKRKSLSELIGYGDNERRLLSDLISGANDISGRGVIAPLLGMVGDLGGALNGAGVWTNNKIKDLEYATGMLKPDMSGNRKGYLRLDDPEPYGGSEHIGRLMQDKGLVTATRRPKTELLASLISPGAALKSTLNAGKSAGNLLRLVDNLESAPTMARMGQRGAIDVWHGTDVEFGKPNTPLFLGDRKMAEAYALRRADESGSNPILMGGTANFKKTASEDDVKRIAKSVGVVVENDMAFHALDPNINGRHNSKKLIDALRAEGYDSAHVDDFSPDDPFTLTKSYVAFDPDQLNLKPQTGLAGLVAPQDEALRVAQQNAALPVEQGGLGLHPNNTPEERAAAMGAEKANLEARSDVYWHASPSHLLNSPLGIHIGTKKAAQQALEARIGVPASGYGWTGGSKYGDTMIAGRDSLLQIDPRGYNQTGFNSRPPDADYLPDGSAKYGNGAGELISLDTYPANQPYLLKGEMSNERYAPMSDTKANGLMPSMIKRGKAKRGYFYKNDGEDAGSISAVVPNGDWLTPLNEQLMLELPNKKLRSRLAAFDPKRRDSSDLLAGLAPIGLGALIAPPKKKEKKK